MLGFLRRRGKPSIIGVLVEGSSVPVEAQKRAIDEWANAEGVKIERWVTVKAGDAPEAGKGDVLVMCSLRSLGNSPGEAARVYEGLRKRGVKLVQVHAPEPGQPSMGC